MPSVTDDISPAKPLPPAPPAAPMPPRPGDRAEGKRVVAAAFYSILAVLVLYHGIQGDVGVPSWVSRWAPTPSICGGAAASSSSSCRSGCGCPWRACASFAGGVERPPAGHLITHLNDHLTERNVS